MDKILSGDKAQQRAEIIKKFIKIAKALMGTNNLNAAHAILNALDVEAIQRLEKTWKVSE